MTLAMIGLVVAGWLGYLWISLPADLWDDQSDIQE